jgi:hypothetical protein
MFEPGAIDLDLFAAGFFATGSNSGRYWEHLVGWWRRRREAGVLLCYEDILLDLDSAVARVASHLRIEPDPRTREKVVHQAGRDFMHAHAQRFDDHLLRDARNEACGLPPGGDLGEGGGRPGGACALPRDRGAAGALVGRGGRAGHGLPGLRVVAAHPGHRVNILIGELYSKAVSALSEAEIEEIWQFTSRHVTRPRALFEHMLLTRDQVHVIRDREGRMRGFAAELVQRGVVGGRQTAVVFGNMGALDEDFRGGALMQLAGLRTALLERLRHPTQSTWGPLAASSYRPLSAVNRAMREHWPHPDGPTPPHVREVMDALVPGLLVHVPERRWNSERGVVEVTVEEQWHHKVSRDPSRERSALRRWYEEMNPGEAKGDCLLLIFPLHVRNLLWLAAYVPRSFVGHLHARLRAWVRAMGAGAHTHD